MTVASSTNPARNDYTGNSSTTVYNFTFPVLKESNRADNKEYSIKVIITENETDTVKTETTDYTVTLDEDTRLGTITFGTAPTATQKITFISDVDVSQATDYNNIGTGAFPADSHEKALDKLTILFRQFIEKENRAISLPESSSLSNLEIPVSNDNANKALVVNNAGDNIEVQSLADIGTAPVTDFAKTLLDDTTNTQARTTLDAEQKANSLTEKSSVVANDKFIIADSEDSNNSKKVSYSNFLLASQTQKGLSILNKPITIANNSSDSEHDIDFSTGVINFDDGTGQAVATALTKKLDASWVAGTSQGGLDTGSIAANTWYYCFAIYNPTTSTADFLFSASYSSPTLPSGYTKKEYRGAVFTDASSNIRNGNFTYFPDGSYRFTYNVGGGIKDFDETSIGTSRTAVSLSCPPNRLAMINAHANDNDSTTMAILITEEGQTDTAPGNRNCTINPGEIDSARLTIKVNSSSQIYYRSNDGSVDLFVIATIGFYDNIL